MGRPVDTAAVAARRRTLVARVGRGVVLIPAAHERNIERDYVQDNDFRQNNTFFYFTELETQDAGLLIAGGGEAAGPTLFLPAGTPAQERWPGRRLGPDTTAARLSGIARVVPTDSLDRVLSTILIHAPGPIYAPLDPTTRDEPRLKELVFAGRDVRNVRPIVDSLRLVKDADELARLRRAVDISALGHVAAIEATRPGMWEYEIAAVVAPPFPPTAAAPPPRCAATRPATPTSFTGWGIGSAWTCTMRAITARRSSRASCSHSSPGSISRRKPWECGSRMTCW